MATQLHNRTFNTAESLDDIVSPTQCRMARAALRISVRELASRARTTPKTLCKFENGTDIHPTIKRGIRAALEREGAVFIAPTPEHRDGLALKAG